jgi:GNAT superfamily N-acetyltransferase
MSVASQPVAAEFYLRQITEKDDAFRYQLFTETAGAEFMAIVGNKYLLEMQYRARNMSYATSFPGAEERLICLSDGRPVGRLLVYLQPGVMRLVDIGLLKSHREQGIGTTVLKNLQQRCQDEGSELELQVARTSRAEKFYLQMGFLVTGQDAIYTQMRWQPKQLAGR